MSKLNWKFQRSGYNADNNFRKTIGGPFSFQVIASELLKLHLKKKNLGPLIPFKVWLAIQFEDGKLVISLIIQWALNAKTSLSGLEMCTFKKKQILKGPMSIYNCVAEVCFSLCRTLREDFLHGMDVVAGTAWRVLLTCSDQAEGKILY